MNTDGTCGDGLDLLGGYALNADRTFSRQEASGWALVKTRPYHAADVASRYDFLLRCRPLRHVFIPDGWQN